MKGIITAASLAVLSSLSAPMVYTLHQNVHTVIPNQVYRSAQLSTKALDAIINADHIRTIINLRGENRQNEWYRDEIETSKKRGIQHYDIRLGSKTFPSPAQLQQLAHLIETTPKPLLIHCRCGADRTGLGSAMTLALLTQQPMSAIEKQYSWKYLVASDRSVGKQVFRIYQRWLSENNKTTSNRNFKTWIASNHYAAYAAMESKPPVVNTAHFLWSKM